MYTVTLVVPEVSVDPTDYSTLADALKATREVWNEEESGPQVFTVTKDDGSLGAILMRDAEDPEICHTMFSDGSRVHHRCHYNLTEEGMYASTTVTGILDEE